MPTQIRDLKSEALKASELKLDHRWKQYVKWIDGIDEKLNDGYSIIGGFIGDGTISVEIGKRRLLLVCANEGSAKYHHGYYRVLILEADGTLTPTDITTEDEKKGWALRIREPIKNLLATLNPPSADQPVKFKLNFEPEVYAALAAHKALNPDKTYGEIVLLALAALDQKVGVSENDTTN